MRTVGTLSGGQRRRVDLARLLIGDWDVLALDEPTNHLDVRAITWLASHLKNALARRVRGALLVVTHDRWFLDEVCTRMWEVHDRMVEPFEGGFSAYILQRVERDRLGAAGGGEAAEQPCAASLRGFRAGPEARRGTKPKFHVDAAQALIADVPPLRNALELKRMAMARLGKQVVRAEERHGALRRQARARARRRVTGLSALATVTASSATTAWAKPRFCGLSRACQAAHVRAFVKIGKTVKFRRAVAAFGQPDGVSANDRVRQVISTLHRAA